MSVKIIGAFCFLWNSIVVVYQPQSLFSHFSCLLHLLLQHCCSVSPSFHTHSVSFESSLSFLAGQSVETDRRQRQHQWNHFLSLMPASFSVLASPQCFLNQTHHQVLLSLPFSPHPLLLRRLLFPDDLPPQNDFVVCVSCASCDVCVSSSHHYHHHHPPQPSLPSLPLLHLHLLPHPSDGACACVCVCVYVCVYVCAFCLT